jgi:hypothetical protein
MSRQSALAAVRVIYDEVHAALWAGHCVGLLYFVTVVAPALPAARANMERQRMQEIAAESHAYCEKWGMPAGTHRHVLCVLDLQAIRTKVEQREAADSLL